MALSRRFGTTALSHYRTVFDEAQATQFAAVSISLGDGRRYLSFSGTDNTIVGWQEDFCMGSEVVPAQREAVRYLEETMMPNEKYRIGGHSKGGNLAIYSALHCKEELRRTILAVYNNDGPGLSADIVPPEQYERIGDRLHWIIPEYSVIGTLFPHGAPSKIVASTGKGLLQHDPFTWQIEGDAFCEKAELSESCRFYVDIFDTWINSADLEHRRTFTHDFFHALRAGGAQTIQEVLDGGLDEFGTILLSIVQSESRTKIVIGKLIKSFFLHCKEIDLRETIRSKTALRGGLLLAAGILLMLFPDAALRFAGMLFGGAGIVLLGRRILSCAVSADMDMKQKKLRILSCLACMIALEFLIANKSIFMISSHFILGVALLAFALYTLYRTAKQQRPFLKRVPMYGVSIIAILLSVVAFTKGGEEGALVFTLGTFSVAYGIISIARAVYRSGVYEMGKLE